MYGKEVAVEGVYMSMVEDDESGSIGLATMAYFKLGGLAPAQASSQRTTRSLAGWGGVRRSGSPSEIRGTALALFKGKAGRVEELK